MPWGWERLIVAVMPHVDGFADQGQECSDFDVSGDARRKLAGAREFLWEDERIVLDMLADGKGPTDIAEVFGYANRQTAAKMIRRVIQAAGFYCRNLDTMVNMVKLGPHGSGDLDGRHIRLVHALVIERRTYEDVGQFFEKSRAWVTDELKKIRQAAKTAKKFAVVKMLDDFDECKAIRNRRRRMPKDTKWREKFRGVMCTLNDGGVWYVWGGQNPFGKCELLPRAHGMDAECDCSQTADCSGLVLEVLKRLGKLPKAFPDMTAQSLSQEFARTTKPKPGDLAFYGRDWRHVTHVMFYYGELEYRADKKISDAVVGMCGGRRNMVEYEARLFGGMLKFQRSPRYRRDLLGFRTVA